MDILSNIRVFIAITEQNSLGRAADKLNISPSSASKQISSLEDYKCFLHCIKLYETPKNSVEYYGSQGK